MKKLITLCIALVVYAGATVNAQSETCEIPLMVYMSQQTEPFPVTAQSYLNNKLTQVVSNNGLAASDGYAQFLISTNFSVLGKSILPGPPRSFVYDFDLNLYIGDYLGQKIFSSTSINVKGVGENETKAYIDAIKKIKPKSKDLQGFVEEGKQKIIKYYNENYQSIIKKSLALAQQKQYDEAMFYLMAIPECSTGYDKALDAAQKVYQLYVDDMCHQYLNKAKMAWVAQQNADGAYEAGEYLAYIYPDAKCYGEAQILYKEIKSKVKEDWNFALKVYDDAVSLEKQRINAWKEVGVAFGKNQQPRTTEIIWTR